MLPMPMSTEQHPRYSFLSSDAPGVTHTHDLTHFFCTHHPWKICAFCVHASCVHISSPPFLFLFSFFLAPGIILLHARDSIGKSSGKTQMIVNPVSPSIF